MTNEKSFEITQTESYLELATLVNTFFLLSRIFKQLRKDKLMHIPEKKKRGRVIFRPYITVNGVRKYARQFGHKAWPIPVDD